MTILSVTNNRSSRSVCCMRVWRRPVRPFELGHARKYCLGCPHSVGTPRCLMFSRQSSRFACVPQNVTDEPSARTPGWADRWIDDSVRFPLVKLWNCADRLSNQTSHLSSGPKTHKLTVGAILHRPAQTTQSKSAMVESRAAMGALRPKILCF